ncbi:hypothetical protein [Ensifer sp. LC163]|uniref:hypothetical protein n=1 Tax=Ensifer sp. LC163 TaxID=1120652 RepID=UPI00111277D6|nr:hypothetical protein [Ensifer sp. LC163]
MLNRIKSTLSGAGKLCEFGLISGAIGLASDLGAPIGNFRYWTLLIGVLLLIATLPLIRRIGWDSDLAKSTAVFGIMLTAMGTWSITQGGDNGAAAERSQLIAEFQSKLLGLEKNVEAIAKNTAETADNTLATAENTDRTAENTKALAENLFDASALENAIEYRDFRKMTRACASGERKDGFDAISPGRYDKVKEDAIYQHLRTAGCIDTAIICTTETDKILLAAQDRGYDPRWLYPISDALPNRVEELCGRKVKAAYIYTKSEHERKIAEEVAAEAAAREQAEAQLQQKVNECEKEIGDPNWCRLAVEAKIYKPGS